ncbi:T9SS type A sorting domain-containing protein [Nonlabens xylanidelens]|uniref:T9SS type A sorting domain-containing protein n=1 Tax=Nonlabens xylanidelens TaxID=191564 RepID=UPI000CF3FD21|nr:T9SS type A sorting domain-containing protein [Nonlabens xylanidelens]
MRKLILLGFVMSCLLSYSQEEGNFWYFGQNAGLDFSTTPPTPLSNGQINTLEGCTAISDNLGNLLFYSDGVTVWNRNHSIMLNGTGLAGSPTSVHSSIAVKDLSSTSKWYLFTIGDDFTTNTGLSYSVIDMSLDSGLGGIMPSQKNILINANFHEKLAITKNATNDGYWLLTFDQPNYYAYRVGQGSVDSTTPVISNVPISSVLQTIRGVLKFSPDGTKVINTSVRDSFGAILSVFDTQTGIVSTSYSLTHNDNAYSLFHGAEFSPDSNLVYLNANSQNFGNACLSYNRRIYQYDVSGGSTWNSTPFLLANSLGTRGALQLGRDGKIYISRNCQPWLAVINNPTIPGSGANYVFDGIALTPNTESKEGLPYTGSTYYYNSFNEISGHLTIDTDQNGCNNTDPKYPSIFLNLNSTNYNSFTFSDNNGKFRFVSPNGQFTVTPNPENPTYWNFSPPNVIVDFPTQTSPFTQDFCVTANGSIEDLEVIVVPLEQARPGFDTDYKVVVKNKGNVTTSGTVTLDFEEDFMNLLSSTPIATTPATNQLSWSVSNLQPFQMEEYEFTMTLNTPTQTLNPLNGNDILTFTGTVTGTGTDAMPADNTMVFDQTVVNSYDPNDKTCLEGKTMDPSDVGEYVHYMIRFENTGTASAVNIVVKDEIDLAQFDITTLIPLGGSHDYYTRVRDNNVVEFIHEDINLDFNDATNDGYVLFKIKTLNTLVAGDTFDNTADIFFDFNAPIVTNTETVSIMSTASVGEATDNSISIYPNPANNFINATANNAIESISITDMNGRMITATQFTGASNEQRVEIGELSSGIYFVTIKSNAGQKIEKLLVE